MRIGFLSQSLPYLPARDGFRIYSANLLRALSVNHEIDLVSLVQAGEEEKYEWAQAHCRSFRPLEPGVRSTRKKIANFVSSYAAGKPLVCRAECNRILREAAAENRWDVVHIEGGFAGGLIEGVPPIPAVLSVHDAESLRAREMLRCKLTGKERGWYWFRKYAQPRYDRLVYPRFDRTVVVAARDCKFLKELAPNGRFEVISSGIDTHYFHPVALSKNAHETVFHGHLSYPPNVEAAVHFVDRVFPLIRAQEPSATFHIVGAQPKEEIRELATREGIRLSANLADLREAVSSAQVYACPILQGTGLKNKLLEAMAMEMPIVAFDPETTSGIDCVAGEHLLGAASTQGFATAVLELFRAREKAARMGRAARQLVVKNYSWESRARMYEELYRTVITERHRQPLEGLAAGSANEQAQAGVR